LVLRAALYVLSIHEHSILVVLELQIAHIVLVEPSQAMRLDVLSLRMELRLLVHRHTHVVKRLTSLRKRSAKAVGYLISPSHKLPRNTQISSGVVSEVLVEPLKLCDLGLLHLVMDKLLLHLALLLVRNSNGRWLLNSALKVHVHIHVDVHADILVLTGLINVLG
jgi:hypothetical protein